METLIINVRTRCFSCGITKDNIRCWEIGNTHTHTHTRVHNLHTHSKTHTHDGKCWYFVGIDDIFKGHFNRDLIQFVSIYSFLTESNAQKAFELARQYFGRFMHVVCVVCVYGRLSVSQYRKVKLSSFETHDYNTYDVGLDRRARRKDYGEGKGGGE